MIESIVAIVATIGAPVASPMPSHAVVATQVASVEIEATDELPSLDYAVMLPPYEQAMEFWKLASQVRCTLDERRRMGANNLDALIAEAEYRRKVWDIIADANNPWWRTKDRRCHLDRLRHLVGDEVYFSGAWPAPSPFMPRLIGGQ